MFSNNHKYYQVVIVGAGAAGLMCAIEAGKRGRSVLLIDHVQKVGGKILISGGGRCNFTNTGTTPKAYVSENSHFCKSALSRYTPADFIRLVEDYRIAYHEKKLGQLFCDNSAKQIVELLLAECKKAGVVFQLSTKVLSLKKEEPLFSIKTDQGNFSGTSVVVATGGLSIPQMGATDWGYKTAEQFGLKIVPTAAALDGFVLSPSLQKDLSELSGVSIDSVVTCNGISFRENILFTHKGLSGPAILQASLYWTPKSPIFIDLFPDTDIAAWLIEKKKEGSKAEVKTLLGAFLSKSAADYFTKLYFQKSEPLIQVPDQALKTFGALLKKWEIVPAATVGYQKAEVTRGGVSTDELSSKTMESKKVSGLYFIGEVVDVTGWLGGYNFQWAWASGWTAGQYV
jgi:hypothetical protein